MYNLHVKFLSLSLSMSVHMPNLLFNREHDSINPCVVGLNFSAFLRLDIFQGLPGSCLLVEKCHAVLGINSR